MRNENDASGPGSTALIYSARRYYGFGEAAPRRGSLLFRRRPNHLLWDDPLRKLLRREEAEPRGPSRLDEGGALRVRLLCDLRERASGRGK